MKRIIVLGGGADQVDFVKELKNRGYYVIIIDYNINPIAKPFADLHIPESTLDVETVKKIAEGLEVERVVTACTDQALMTVATVSESLGLPTQFTSEDVRNFTQKAHMKRLMEANNIPTAKFKVIRSINDSTDGLKFPLIIKPSDCNSSKGVRKVVNRKEYGQYIENALKLSRTKTAIAEEFLEGIEVSIDAYVTADCTKILMIGLLGKKFVGPSTQIIYQNIIPANISSVAKKNIQEIATQISDAFNIKNSPLLIQAIVNGDEVKVIEFSARLGGGCKHKTIKSYTNIDIIKANVDSILGETPEIKVVQPKNTIISRLHLYLKPGIFKEIYGLDNLVKDGIITEFTINKPKGSLFNSPKASTDRLGSVLIEADSISRLNEKKRMVLETVMVIDENNAPMMDDSIYKDDL